MREFVDLKGASGAAYRFRLWPEGAAHLPMAGNYAFVRDNGDAIEVLLADISDDLSTERRRMQQMNGADLDQVQIYTRLNVSRSVREAENDDIVAHYSPPLSVRD